MLLLSACGGGGGDTNPPDDADLVPDTFAFAALENAAPGLVYLSESQTIAGLDNDAQVAISISGADCAYAVNDGEFRDAAGSVSNDDTVRIRSKAADGFETATSCTLDIGGVTGAFSITTGASTFSLEVSPGELNFSWGTFTGITRYELTRHNSVTGESVFIADDIEGTVSNFTLPVSVHLTDWINDRFLLSACNELGCITLPEHEATLVQALSAQAITYAKASNTEEFNSFGVNIALDGDTLVVGADGENSAATGVNGNQVNDCAAVTPANCATASGAVYVFRRNGTAWIQEAYIKASNTDLNDRFGVSVALDGDTLAVGAYQEDSAATDVNGDELDSSAANSGAVYVFRRNGTTWAQEAYVKASNTEEFDRFGISVALDGDTLAVGAYTEDSATTGVSDDQDFQIDDCGAATPINCAEDSGAVYVFRRNGIDWAQEAYVKASNTDASDTFGRDIALAGDTLAVGAYQEDSAATGVNGDATDNSAATSGAVYVFHRTGTTWAQEAYVKASNTDPYDRFGTSVALDDNILAVGAVGEGSAATGVNGDQDDDSAQNGGAAYVFRRTGTAWFQEAYIKASNTVGDELFGSSVALDGEALAVGSRQESSAATGVNGNQASDCDTDTSANCADDSGAAYVFRRTDAVWTQDAYVKASNTDGENFFGESLALAGDTLAVGAEMEDSAATGMNGNQTDDCEVDETAENCAQRSGAVYIY
ncbi:MAG TPA: hypothetical protein VF275_11085 [Gammaproteobacteria bacterium]